MKPDYYPFQIAGIEFLSARKGAILADDPGLGKTYQALGAAVRIDRPVMIVCTSLNKAYWRKIIKLIDPSAPIAWSIDGGYFNEDALLGWFKDARKGYFLTHHEALRHRGHLTMMMGVWGAIIADEGHKFKNRNAAQTIALKKHKAIRKWAPTATPIDKSPAEFWSLLNWFNSSQFSSYWNFQRNYCNEEKSDHVPWKVATSGVKLEAMDDFAKLVSPYYLRREKAEVAPQLPPLTFKDVPLEMSKGQAEVINQLKKRTFIQLTQEQTDLEQQLFVRNALAKYAFVRKATLDPSLIGADARGVKADWIWDFAQGFTGQFVVFAVHRDWIHALPALVPNGVAVVGGMSDKELDRSMSAFYSGDAQYLAGTIDMISESLNLQNAKVSIFPELHRSSIKMRQAYDRIHRLDSLDPAMIIRLMHPNSTDTIALDSLELKLSDIDLVNRFLRYLGE